MVMVEWFSIVFALNVMPRYLSDDLQEIMLLLSLICSFPLCSLKIRYTLSYLMSTLFV